MRIHSIAAAALATAVACGSAAAQPADNQASTTIAPSATPKPLTATVEIKDKEGAVAGTATLTEQTTGVRVVLTVSKLAAGQHGWHIHTVGKCEPSDFASAGGHFNPDARQHGAHNAQGAHAGDLGNLTVGADGTARVDVVANVTLVSGAVRSVFDTDGSAIVIHAGPDDEKTDPAGNSGPRIACGVVRPAER